jgi:hypothetical protein
MRLDVGESAAEEFFGPIDGQRLDLVDELASAVVSAPGVAFGVLVRENRSLSRQYGLGHDVLRRDQFNLMLLTFQFAIDRSKDSMIERSASDRLVKIHATYPFNIPER